LPNPATGIVSAYRSLLTENEVFQAASILKNKMMYDFVALRIANGNDPSFMFQMRQHLLAILQNLSDPSLQVPRFILNSLSTALAYLTIHVHSTWPSMIEDTTQALSQSLDSIMSLLSVLKYMANDCDN
jgi:hypothetical protein